LRKRVTEISFPVTQHYSWSGSAKWTVADHAQRPPPWRLRSGRLLFHNFFAIPNAKPNREFEKLTSVHAVIQALPVVLIR
jgi:hypothetical protein